MQYLVLLNSLFLGATATLVEQRQTSPQPEVSSFTAHTNFRGNGASIGYDFEITGLVNTHCNYTDTASGSTVPSVGLTYCEDPAVKWEFFHEPAPMGAPIGLSLSTRQLPGKRHILKHCRKLISLMCLSAPPMGLSTLENLSLTFIECVTKAFYSGYGDAPIKGKGKWRYLCYP
ncbi:hypothetical protein F4823DRAFT_568594 [Ustulina deusta]|nr:hypothetical protein F4823DRAFT_568594 [Ustulina deusta]